MNDNLLGLCAFSLFQIILLSLKLDELIDWAWLWVLSPTWILVVIVAIGAILIDEGVL